MASLLLLLLVLAATLMPAVWILDSKVQALLWFESVDKWLHGITFLVLSLWFTGLYNKHDFWKIGIGLVLFGIVIEAFQRFVSYRTADWIDVAADVVGIVLGLVLGLAGICGWCLRAEERLARREQ